MRLTVFPGYALRGTARVPGDKSLSHRAVLFAALAEGQSRIHNFLVSGVTEVMLRALTDLGVAWHLEGDTLTVEGRGLAGLRAPEQPIHCGNSATTIRLLAGALAAAGIPAVLDGSPGLRSRPMGRIVEPLQQMGVAIAASGAGTAPLRLNGRPTGSPLTGLNLDLPVASAQVKSCLLLAGLAAQGETVLREPGPSRDHTERMLNGLGVQVTNTVLEEGRFYETRLTPPGAPLRPFEMTLPGDISAAAFLMTAATITPGSQICIQGVGLNPTRTGLIDALCSMGADIRTANISAQGGELSGDILVQAARLHGTGVSGALVVRMIDEFSILGAAAAAAQGETTVRDAAELRYKESDRIGTLCQELRALGIAASEAEDGFTLQGGTLQGGVVQAHGDHRLAMALAVAGLAAHAPVTVEGAEIIHESFPDFVATLVALGAHLVEEPGQPAAGMRPACFHLGLLGYPLSHSRSPELHQAALAAAGLEGDYRLFAYPPTPAGLAEIAARLDELRSGRLQGLNVTIPHKQAVIPLVDRLTEVAGAVGAVNTLYIDPNGALTGDNTDVPGFLHDLQGLVGSASGRALVMGAGGSARAVVYALARAGWQVQVLARREEQADGMVAELGHGVGHGDTFSGQVTAGLLSRENLAQVDCDLLVNTTPVGMYPEVHGSPWPKDVPLPKEVVVYDLVYNPIETALVKRARVEQHVTRSGAGMLVAQAALAFQLWTGLEAPFEVMQKAFH